MGNTRVCYIFCTAASLIETFPFLLRLSRDVFFIKGDCRTFPVYSCLLFNFCLLLQTKKWCSAFCYMLKHSGFHFFLTLSFKWFNFLNEAFELYQHGLLKTGCKTIWGDFSHLQTVTCRSSPLPPVISHSAWICFVSKSVLSPDTRGSCPSNTSDKGVCDLAVPHQDPTYY